MADNPYKAYCKFCERELHTHRLSLLKHCTSLKHEVGLKEFQQSIRQKSLPLSTKETLSETSTSDKPIHNYSMKYTSCPSTSKSMGILTKYPKKRHRTESLDASNSLNKNDLLLNNEKVFHTEDDWVDNENEDYIEEDHTNELLGTLFSENDVSLTLMTVRNVFEI